MELSLNKLIHTENRWRKYIWKIYSISRYKCDVEDMRRIIFNLSV